MWYWRECMLERSEKCYPCRIMKSSSFNAYEKMLDSKQISENKNSTRFLQIFAYSAYNQLDKIKNKFIWNICSIWKYSLIRLYQSGKICGVAHFFRWMCVTQRGTYCNFPNVNVSQCSMVQLLSHLPLVQKTIGFFLYHSSALDAHAIYKVESGHNL